MKEGSPEETVEFLQQRVTALEEILDSVLPMLIQDAPHFRDIQQTLQEWYESPPPRVQGNEAFLSTVEDLLNALPAAG